MIKNKNLWKNRIFFKLGHDFFIEKSKRNVIFNDGKICEWRNEYLIVSYVTIEINAKIISSNW